ncbi:hypothetical protein [Kosakonia oryzae]|uniref:Uncharacterized protein n=1 Tax=Kosakonia oryzae TaxID=497725 RepID=A0AA94KNE5_9ENTR|nr:hypothetical protein [Kosakonia oryzae]ANI83953.1 hypothetical protein AWR26_18035 [Kosakonia oryzae]SFB74429.1 hypothetical protein SAMN05216286_0621 [Kosakonia oryzae]
MRGSGIFKMKYTGKIILLIYAVIQAGVSFFVIKISSDFLSSNLLNLSITYAILSLILGLVSLLREHISIYVDLTSPYNKEKIAHNETKQELEEIKEQLEEKKDYIHSITSNLNNTFVGKKTKTSKLEEIEKIVIMLNNNAKLANCGNSKLSKDSKGDLLKMLMATGDVI